LKKNIKKASAMGVCGICKQPVPKSQIARHLKTCRPSPPATGKPVEWFHLAIECPYLPEYWLHIDIPGAQKLADLDGFLRGIWLECCGHLSSFIIDGICYDSNPDTENLFGGPPAKSMTAKLYAVLKPGSEFEYEYDFGSTTELVLKVVDVTLAPAVRGNPIRILARNAPPEFRCASCKQPATKLADGGNGLDPDHCYCDDCAEELDDDEQDMLMPIVNSPRVGVCGYCG